ncbi:hypothetical protein [Rhodococcus sp. Leaf233]|uniref:hypothetical protein n=1 Tax=Rhodococcus sp. Leaf233 TaxID=1736302 RepID=UPI00070BC216|nr:hypothetical protein [Rhodococcus sp. Leaf233]KQU37458.1 hypothetical protein ASH04_04085 [Rhodococcus sp. Leaf233]
MTTDTDALLPALPTDTEADQPCSSLQLFASAVHPADRGDPDESLPRDLLIDIRWIGTPATATRAELRTAIPRFRVSFQIFRGNHERYWWNTHFICNDNGRAVIDHADRPDRRNPSVAMEIRPAV